MRQIDRYADPRADLDHSAVSVVPPGRAAAAVPAPPRLDAVIAAAKRHAGQRGRMAICLALPHRLSHEEIARLARAHPDDSFVVQHELDGLDDLRERLPDAALGAWSPSGRWILPPGIMHVYFAGSVRAVSMAMLRQVVRNNALSLVVLWQGRWFDLPLRTIRRLAERRYRMRRTLAAVLRPRQSPRWAPPVRPQLTLAQPEPAAAQPEPAVAQAEPATVQPELPAAEGLPGILPESAATAELAPAAKANAVRRRRAGLVSPAEIGALIGAAASGSPLEAVPGRVMQVCGSLAPGGAERQAAYTTRGVAGQPDIESCEMLCDYLTPGHPLKYDFYLPLLREAGVRARVIEQRFTDEQAIEALPAVGGLLGLLPESVLCDVANLHAHFLRHRPEVVHAWLDWSNVRAGLAAALAGVPRIILSGRNVNPTHFAFYQPYMDPVYHALCALPNVLLINNSLAGAQDYAAWLGLPRGSVKVVHNGFDTSAPSPTAEAAAAIRGQLEVPPDWTLVGGVFRFSQEKRPLLWVQTAAAVARARPEVCFVLFGDGPMREQMQSLARRTGIADRLRMPGITSEVLAAMRAMDLLLLTSVDEGLPNVLIESQWVGTPVIATDAGGAAEAVDDGRSGWIAREARGDVLAEHVLRVLNDAAWRDRARTLGPAFVRERFGMQRMIQRTLDLYAQPLPALRAEAAA